MGKRRGKPVLHPIISFSLPVSGVPVRCFQIDNTINDLLAKGIKVSAAPTGMPAARHRHCFTAGMLLPSPCCLVSNVWGAYALAGVGQC